MRKKIQKESAKELEGKGKEELKPGSPKKEIQ